MSDRDHGGAVGRNLVGPWLLRAGGRLAWVLGAGSGVAWMAMMHGAAVWIPVLVPNGSFETPSVPFVSTHVASWEEVSKPPAYEEGGGFTWDQLTGVFANTPPGAGDHIDNTDGAQAIYLFAVPGVGIFQDFDSRDWTEVAPSGRFNVLWEPGARYRLSFGLIGGGGAMREGVALEAALYYRDELGQARTVAWTNVSFNLTHFPNRTHLTALELEAPPVRSTDPWAGRHLGIRFLSTVSVESQGGYWDLDDVRLDLLRPPTLVVEWRRTGDEGQLLWGTAVGFAYWIETSIDLRSWVRTGGTILGTGEERVVAFPMGSAERAYFRVRAEPTLP